MDNYLSHRWPGAPIRFESTGPYRRPDRPQRPRKRVALRVVAILAVVVLVGLLIASACWAALRLASSPEDNPSPGVTDRPDSPRPSRKLPIHSDWSPDQLPWGEPDPSVQLALNRPIDTSPLPREIYDMVLPSIVCVETECDDGYSIGSGIVMTASGYILTNYHVIDEGIAIEVMMLEDQSVIYDATVIGYDEDIDIAILKVDPDEPLTPASFGSSDALSVGDQVYAIGNPMGYLYGSMTEGIVSALHREVEVEGHSDITLIQTSAPVNSGNSGGALVNAQGQIVGVVSAKITGVEDDTVIEGIGLAIPTSDALPFINYILRTGETCRPALGIMCIATRQDGRRGILVKELTPDTPAAEVLHEEDLILSANGSPTPTLYDLTRALYDTGVGRPVALTVLRDNEVITVSVVLYDRLAED